MVERTSRPGLVVAVAVCVVLGSLGLLAVLSGIPGGAPLSTRSGQPVDSSSALDAKAGTVSSSTPGLGRALAVENILRAKGISPAGVHLPNFASAVANRFEQVTPQYTHAPAPMGVADLGLENHSGVLVPYELNTTSVAGTVNITNLTSLYLDGDGPDTYGMQLNSVAAGVTIFGNSSYEFWSQNYVDYTPSTQQLVFGDEVWNFSTYSTYFPANGIYAFGPNGTWADFPALYQGYGPAITIAYPFTLTLYLNTSTLADRPAFYFNYTVSNSTFRQSESYDYLVFNSTNGTPTEAAPTPYYQANGYNYDPVGLSNDMEIDLLGNCDGDIAAFTTANATISLDYWNATARAMQEVPSAFNAGQDTGETSVGLSVTSSGGPSPIAMVRAGPSFLAGLWNYSGNYGAVPVTVTVLPAYVYSFLFVNLGTGENDSASEWVPTSPNGTTAFYVPTGGTYFLEFLASEYRPYSTSFTVTAATTLPTITLTRDRALGIYAPLFALNNAELRGISSGGAGTASDPWVLDLNQHTSLAPQFAQWDVYLFPLFPGLLIAGTSQWINVTPPSFEINLPSWELQAADIPALGTNVTLGSLGLPLTNNLQIEFYDASNISLVNAPAISGWFSAFLSGWPASAVMLWGCTNVLVASNTFQDEGNAMTLYDGSNNTIWGNRFLDTAPIATNPATLVDSGPSVTGINESEQYDLIYNNFFEVPIPATTPTYDLFDCGQYGECSWVTYNDTWNVSEQPAKDYALVNGWNLTGSIIGTWYQGGNYWSNYGLTGNPYGVLPYNDSGWITLGGDSVPLVPFALYPVTFQETGLPAGSVWSINASGVSVGTNLSTIEIDFPNGTFALTVSGPSNYYLTAPSNFTVSGASVTAKIVFTALVVLDVRETGLAVDAEWTAWVTGAGTGNVTVTASNNTEPLAFAVPPGDYHVTAAATGYTVSPPNVTAHVGANGGTATFTFTPLPGLLVVTVSPMNASVWVNSAPVKSTNGTAYLTLPAGVIAIEVTYSGYYPYFNNVTVTSGAMKTVTVALTAVPSTSSSGYGAISTNGWILIGVLATLALIFLVGMIYFSRRPRRGVGAPGAPPAQEWQEPPPPAAPPPT